MARLDRRTHPPRPNAPQHGRPKPGPAGPGSRAPLTRAARPKRAQRPSAVGVRGRPQIRRALPLWRGRNRLIDTTARHRTRDQHTHTSTHKHTSHTHKRPKEAAAAARQRRSTHARPLGNQSSRFRARLARSARSGITMTRRLAFALLAAFALAAAVPLACAAPASVKYSAAAKLDQGAQVELSAEEALWQPYAEPASTIEAPQAAEAEGAGRRLLGAPLRFRMANDRVRVNRNPDWMLHHDKMPKQHGKGRGMQGHTNHNTGRPEEDGDMRRRLLSAQGAQEIESAQALLALDAAKAMLAAEREDAAKALLSAEREDAAKAALSAEREDAAKAALATEETKWVPYEEPASAKGLARRLLAQRGSDIAHRFRGRTHEKATGFRGHGPFKRGGGM